MLECQVRSLQIAMDPKNKKCNNAAIYVEHVLSKA